LSGKVIVIEYDPDWPALYKQEQIRILAAIGEYIDDIQHVGSTSVPGLGAKPIIDIMIALPDLMLVERCVQPMLQLGYEYLGEFGLPGRHYFHKPAGPVVTQNMQHTHHVHMVQTGSDRWNKHIVFRDYLRLHPEDAQQYYLLKKELADRFGADREGYTDAKTSFVQSILEKASLEE
jgi:GrpB-like predicted nucleotidyltransferase (UPF0157 family)